MAEPTLIQNMHIDTESEDFFKYILCTFPVPPAYIELRAVVHSIPDYDWDKKSINQYLSQCKKNKTIPFSETKLEYNNRKDVFVPGSINLENFDPHIPDNDERLYKKILNNIWKKQISRGKPHTVRIEIGIPAKAGLASFKKTVFDDLLNNGYVIDYGNIWITSRDSGQHYSDSYGGVSTMILGRKGSKYSLDLNLRRDDSELDFDKIYGWFARSKDLYEKS